MTVTSPENLDVKLLHVKRLHARYHGTPQLCRAKALRAKKERKGNKMGFFSRPSMGDRMDNAQEKQYRMRQKAEELAMEQAAAKLHDQRAKMTKHAYKMAQKYEDKKR